MSRTYTAVVKFGKGDGPGAAGDIVAVADRVLATAVGAGATEPPAFLAASNPYGFGGPTPPPNNRTDFYCANLSAVRQEALKAAVADALANARVAAGEARLTVKDIVTITDQSPFGGFGGAGQPAASGRGEVLGEMELTVQVVVTFSY